MQDTASIGQRLRQARTERRLTQAETAALAGISTVMISAIERGERRPGIATIYALAGALGVEPSRLLDKREHLGEGGRDRRVLAVRDALLAVSDLPGITAGDPPVAAAPVDVLERHVDYAWDLYWKGRFTDLAGALPKLITAARASERDNGPAACRPLAQAYQIAADLMVHMGSEDLAFASVMRAVRAAHRGDDPLQHATLAGTASWVLYHQGRLAESEEVAKAGALLVQPSGAVTMAHLTVYGGLLLSAAAPAAAAGRKDAVASYMGEAQIAALRFTEGDKRDYHTNFGPTQMAMQATHQNAVLGEPGAALTAAKRVNPADLMPISFGALHLDIAQAHLDRGRAHAPRAEDALWTAYEVSREWAGQQGLWVSLVAATAAAEGRLSRRMEKLKEAAGVP